MSGILKSLLVIILTISSFAFDFSSSQLMASYPYYITEDDITQTDVKSTIVKSEKMILLDTEFTKGKADRVKIYKGKQLIMEDDFSDLYHLQFYEFKYDHLSPGKYSIVLYEGEKLLMIKTYKINTKQLHVA